MYRSAMQGSKIQGTHPWRFLAFSQSLIALLLSVSLLSGCGFHLKGMGNSAQATYKTVRLIDLNKVNPNIRRALNQQFDGMGVKVVDNLADADVAITFQATRFNRISTGINGQGDISSELLKMNQPMVVDDVKSGKKLLAVTVTSFRDRNVNNRQLQASARELKSIQKQMAVDIALQVIDRANRVYIQATEKP